MTESALAGLVKSAVFASETVVIGDNIKITVSAMNGRDRDAWQKQHMAIQPGTNNEPVMLPKLGENDTAKLIARCNPTLDGEPLVKSDKDIELLGQLPSTDLEKLSDACQRLNGFRDEAVADAAGNSEPDQTE